MRVHCLIRGGLGALLGLAWLGFGSASWAASPDALVFDTILREAAGTAGRGQVLFSFSFTNHAPGVVVIESVKTSCGCTVAHVPTLPWSVPAGGEGSFSVALDARGKRGTLTKSVTLNTSLGAKVLAVRAVLAEPGPVAPVGEDDRARNMQLAAADRFAVFQGECAACHAEPAEGKHGPALYVAACGICHDSPHRASMVPDLKSLPHVTDRDHWIRWITFGKHGSMMPGFASSEGGPLSDDQVDSLVEHLTRTISSRPPSRAVAVSGESEPNAAVPRTRP